MRRLALLLAPGLLLACSDINQPTSAATPTSQDPPGFQAAMQYNYWHPVDFLAEAHCTGDDYIHFTGKAHRAFRVTDDGTNTMRQLWIGQGNADDVTITKKEHITINANGEVTAVKLEFENIDCKEGDR